MHRKPRVNLGSHQQRIFEEAVSCVLKFTWAIDVLIATFRVGLRIVAIGALFAEVHLQFL